MVLNWCCEVCGMMVLFRVAKHCVKITGLLAFPFEEKDFRISGEARKIPSCSQQGALGHKKCLRDTNPLLI